VSGAILNFTLLGEKIIEKNWIIFHHCGVLFGLIGESREESGSVRRT
jgi:hypothetical protein